MKIIKGNGVSEGIALGKVYIYKAFTADVFEAYFEVGHEDEYLQKWHDAKKRAEAELDGVIESLTAHGDADKAKIFEAHKEILFDEEIEFMVVDAIKSERAMPDYAIGRVFGEFIQILGKAKDKLIAERVADLRDVRNRLVRCLAGEPERNLSLLREKVIVVAHDLLPSDTATIDRSKVIGIITEVGGSTSHSAIIARSYKIPAILGVPEATEILKDGDTVIMDATDGTIRIDPEKPVMDVFAQKKSDFDRIAAETNTYLSREARLKDGERIHIGINIGDENNTDGYDYCDYIGLFRTEFLYMGNDHLPTEEEQFTAYKKVMENAKGKPVTLRTLDIGGDKTLKYMQLPKEDNPFLGKRAVRLCFDHPDLFKTQLRAALRASVYGNLQIMFPMIGSIDDIYRAKEFVEAAKRELDAKGQPYAPDVRIGIMIEIPSIAAVADLAAKEVDFASVGTNDLTQYLCAVDRMNSEISSYYQSFSPALIRVLSLIFAQFNVYGKEISVCGELGGDPKAAVILAGLGLRKFSMSPSNIAKVKMALSRFTLAEARRIAAHVQSITTEKEVIEYIEQSVKY
ncbi:MAG: phosphoenolpyruvate--protein phosphotransferase [Oscillospiraceae bacterium]|nr:phosphoenolpyruvate--protein phosphotransferase [Oscillospiraceae bacterium]